MTMPTPTSFRHARRGALAACVALSALALRLHAQVPSARDTTARGEIHGVVGRAEAPDAPIAYAVVLLPAAGIERFTGPEGRFVLRDIPAGAHELVVRRLGYAQQVVKVTVPAGGRAEVAVVLTRIPVRLAGVRVTSPPPCRRPGKPDPAREPELARIFALLVENAERYRLLSTAYPFSYTMSRLLGRVTASSLVTDRADSVVLASGAGVRYRPGRVVRDLLNERGLVEHTVAIPTVVDLADPEFVRQHCFTFGGVLEHESGPVMRVDMRAAERLRSPDIDGSLFLDTASYQLRRIEFSLTRVDRLPRPLRSVASVEVATDFSEIVPGLPVISRVCSVNRLRPQRRARALPTPVELQALVGYRFAGAPPPGVPPASTATTPLPWEGTQRAPRSAVWCDEA